MRVDGAVTTEFTLVLTAREAKAIKHYIADVMAASEHMVSAFKSNEFREMPFDEMHQHVGQFRAALEAVISADAQARTAVRGIGIR